MTIKRKFFLEKIPIFKKIYFVRHKEKLKQKARDNEKRAENEIKIENEKDKGEIR